jgi:hypothetical protein
MAGRALGPLCVTTAERIDPGTNCWHASPRPGPLGMSTSSRPPPAFSKLWASYPSKPPYVDCDGEPKKGYENQCTIKVSAALIGAGQALDGFSGAAVTVGGARLAIRAEELAAWLRTGAPRSFRSRQRSITGSDWQEKIKAQTGIVFFQGDWLRPGEAQPSGDLIDLWKGSRLKGSGLEGVVVAALRFGLGVGSGLGFSDLGKAKRIEFWGLE